MSWWNNRGGSTRNQIMLQAWARRKKNIEGVYADNRRIVEPDFDIVDLRRDFMRLTHRGFSQYISFGQEA
jgi:hypothetical protein